MEKKKNIKTRFMAGALALMLSGAPMTVVKGEEQLVQEETQVELIDMFKTDEDLSNPEYGVVLAHKYVNEDGKIEKWYCSYLSEIDGLKRTDETRLLKSCIANQYDKYEMDGIKEKHAHLFYNSANGYMIPFYSEENLIEYNGEKYDKTIMITQIDEKTLKILQDYCLYRVCDNIILFKSTLEYALSCGVKGLAILKPLLIENGQMNTEIYKVDDTSTLYIHEIMNGFLIDPKVNVILSTNETEDKKEYVIKKKN